MQLNDGFKQEAVKPYYDEYSRDRLEADKVSETHQQITKKPSQFIFIVTFISFIVTMSLYFATRLKKVLVIGILLTVALAIFGRFKSKKK